MRSSAFLQFLGAAGTVTGSKYVVGSGDTRVLLDCGLFQGLKELRARNWQPLPLNAAAIESVVLTHAHIDHSGYLPRLVRGGFRGPVYCTTGTADLLRVLLLDAAHLQEEEARFANKHTYTKHKPARPLFTTDDVEAALRLVEPRPYNQRFSTGGGMQALLRRAGHILGSASIELTVNGRTLVSSGDLGRWRRPILRDPELVPRADVLLIEGTYGDRLHERDPAAALARVVNDAVRRGGVLVVPAFAVGRTQELIWTVRQLEDAALIPSLPVYVDSPMAIDVTALYCRHPEDHDLDMKTLMDEKRCPLCCKQYHLARTPQESKALNARKGPMIIISASGMATGGRILHHLKERLPDERTTVLLPGFQAAGTRGRALQDGARSVRIHGTSVAVRAHVETLHGLSAHADRDEIMRWLRGFEHPPEHTYVVHAETTAAASLAKSVRSELGWRVDVAADGATVELVR